MPTRAYSSAQAMTQLDAMSKQILPNGMNIEWTDLSFQQATQGNTALIVFPVAVLLAFLVLAALYESWTLPLAVILIVPMTMLSALFGVWLTGGDNNVFVQVGLVVLMGLACKTRFLSWSLPASWKFRVKALWKQRWKRAACVYVRL